MAKHAYLSPSSASRWLTCPGSASIQDYSNAKPSIYAAEGTLMHKISEECLRDPDLDPSQLLGQTFKIDGFDIVFTEEFEDTVRFYIDSIWNLKDTYPDAKMSYEKKVYLTKDIYGTADCIIDVKFDTLIVVDLKGGKGVSVSADSPQPKLYAIMAAGKLLETYESIHTIIIQPRDRDGNQYKIAKHDPRDLKLWLENIVQPAIKNANSKNPTFQASEEACRWCTASGTCKYQAELALNVARQEFKTFDATQVNTYEQEMTDPFKLSNTDISKALQLLKFLETWITNVRVHAHGLLLKGIPIDDFKLVEGRVTRKWKDESVMKDVLRKEFRMKVGDIFTKKLKSPPQVLKIIDKKKHEKLTSYIDYIKGNPTIAPESSPKKAILVNAAHDFEEHMSKEEKS